MFAYIYTILYLEVQIRASERNENMVNIIQKFIVKRNNTRPGIGQTVKGIVVHYTANNGGTALNHFNYFNNGANGVYASAHYFVDDSMIVQLIPDKEIAYHANEIGRSKVAKFQGLKSPNGYQGNANSATIGIELCLDKNGRITENTKRQAQLLISDLLAKYNLTVADVYRHYDITGKICPAPMIDNGIWNAFKAGIGPRAQSKVDTVKRNYIGLATVKAEYINLRKDGPNGEVLRRLTKGSKWKLYKITPDGYLDLGGGFASNKMNAYFDIELLWN